MNQTTQMHQISRHLSDFELHFTPYYDDGMLDVFRRLGLIEFSIAGNKLTRRCLRYLKEQGLQIDYHGRGQRYDLVVTCADIVIPENISSSKIILVQEGMTDPEGLFFQLVRRFTFLPRWLASTSVMGLSHRYVKFCVASDGYRDLFIRKGVDPEKLVVTGIPNFDNCRQYLDNKFPLRHFVLVCTSDSRETFNWENRRRTILEAKKIAGNRKLVFKLHPNENHDRAITEIRQYAPGAEVYTGGKAETMIANCDVLITRFSSTVYVGLALGKEVYSEFDVADLRRLTPDQNGRAAENIAEVCLKTLYSDHPLAAPLQVLATV